MGQHGRPQRRGEPWWRRAAFLTPAAATAEGASEGYNEYLLNADIGALSTADDAWLAGAVLNGRGGTAVAPRRDSCRSRATECVGQHVARGPEIGGSRNRLETAAHDCQNLQRSASLTDLWMGGRVV